jgi:hypothetical protein
MFEHLENRCLLTGTPVVPGNVTIQERADQQFTAPLGSFTAVVPVKDVATIQWGDGSSSQGKLVPSGVHGIDTVTLEVDGTHTYAKAGDYNITVDLFGKGALDPFGTLSAKAVVAPAVGTGGVEIDERANKKFTAIVGSFTAIAPAFGLSATIAWGDGRTSKGTLIPGKVQGVDTFTMNVQGTHVYAKAGKFDITVTVVKTGIVISPAKTPVQLITFIDSQAVVSPAVGDGGVTLAEVAGKNFTAKVGQFIAIAPGTGLSGVIDWGDGSTSKATLTPGKIQGIDTFIENVHGTHTYKSKGTYDITISIFKSIPGSPVSTTPFWTIDSAAIVVAPLG